MRKSKTFMYKAVRRLVQNNLHKSVVLLINLLLVLFAFAISFQLFNTTASSPLHTVEAYKLALGIVVGVQIVFFFIFKSYAGIVEYTSASYAYRIFGSVAGTLIVVAIINLIWYQLYQFQLLEYHSLVLYSLFAFLGIYFFREALKQGLQPMPSSNHKMPAYIFGTELTDVAIAENIISSPNKFEVVGFISESNSQKKTNIFTLPIYTIEELTSKLKMNSSVIISAEKLQKLTNANSDVIFKLLALNLKIYKLPEFQHWDEKSISQGIKKVHFEDLLQRNPIKLNIEKLRGLYESRVILVTGAAGSIGADIVKQLLPFQPKKLLLVDQAETPLHHLSVYLDTEHPTLNYESIIADVTNMNRMRQIFEGFSPEIIFHGAAYKHVPMMEANPIEALTVNYLGTKNLVDLSQEYKVKRFVLISTDKAVNPTNIMGASKRCAELYVQLACRNYLQPTTFITTRFGNVLGSNGSVIPHFRKQIEDGGPVTVTHPKINRYFMTIDEACQLVLEAGAMGKGGEIFVFDMGKPIQIVKLAEQMIRLSGFVPNRDIDIVFTGLRPGEKLYEELLTEKENTQPTHHKKILIAKASFEFDDQNQRLLEELTESTKALEASSSVQIVKALIPEYKPTLTSVTKKIIG